MKRLLIILSCLLFLNVKSQTCTLVFDNMETYTWFGDWNTIFNTGFYNNASISPTLSGVLYGGGSGSSLIESANYVLPNVVGLNTIYAHKLTFRLASYRFSNPTAATAGVDGPDYIDVRYSINNGTTYTTEMRIAGNANAYWNYNTAATASKTANGVMTTYAPTAGGNRTTTGDGYSIIELTIPAGATQLAFSLNCRVNSAGEEWWIDNVELIQLGPCVVLPIELISFDTYQKENYNEITWVTATELNNDYFSLERSVDAFNWSEIYIVDGLGTSSTTKFYEYKDYDFTKNSVNYYRLKQTDYDGNFKYFNINYVTNTEKNKSKPIKIVNIMGQEVSPNTPGFLLEIYSDGSTKKIIN
jgi:hypothetical protein